MKTLLGMGSFAPRRRPHAGGEFLQPNGRIFDYSFSNHKLKDEGQARDDSVRYRVTIEVREMRFVSVRDLRGKSAEIWKELSKVREMIITSNGKPIAILSAVSEENLEESLAAFRRARAVAAVESMQTASVEAGTDRMSLEEINAEIAAVRRKRAR